MSEVGGKVPETTKPRIAGVLDMVALGVEPSTNSFRTKGFSRFVNRFYPNSYPLRESLRR